MFFSYSHSHLSPQQVDLKITEFPNRSQRPVVRKIWPYKKANCLTADRSPESPALKVWRWTDWVSIIFRWNKNPIPSMGRTVYLPIQICWWIFYGMKQENRKVWNHMKPGNLLEGATGQPFRKIDISHLWQGKNSPCQPSWDMLVPRGVFFNGSRYLIQYHWVSGIMVKVGSSKFKRHTHGSRLKCQWNHRNSQFSLEGSEGHVSFWNSEQITKGHSWGFSEMSSRCILDSRDIHIVYLNWKSQPFFGENYGISFTLFWRMCFSTRKWWVFHHGQWPPITRSKGHSVALTVWRSCRKDCFPRPMARGNGNCWRDVDWCVLHVDVESFFWGGLQTANTIFCWRFGLDGQQRAR